MMRSSSAARTMRSLSSAEVALVGGGSEPGVNELHDPNNFNPYEADGSAGTSNGYFMIDYNHDGVYDQAWETDDSGNWRTTTDGETWRPDDGPAREWEEHQRRTEEGRELL